MAVNGYRLAVCQRYLREFAHYSISVWKSTSSAVYQHSRVQRDCIEGKTFDVQNKSKWPAIPTSSTSTKAYRLCISVASGTVTPAQREWRASRTLAKFRVEKLEDVTTSVCLLTCVAQQRRRPLPLWWLASAVCLWRWLGL